MTKLFISESKSDTTNVNNKREIVSLESALNIYMKSFFARHKVSLHFRHYDFTADNSSLHVKVKVLSCPGISKYTNVKCFFFSSTPSEDKKNRVEIYIQMKTMLFGIR